jgi:uncharacterized membrane protein
VNPPLRHAPGTGAAPRYAIAALITIAVTACQFESTGTTSHDSMEPHAALQAHVWHCDDGSRIQSRNRPAAIELRIGTEVSTLPQTPAASGARYGNAAMIFWNKGYDATLERRPGSAVACREVRVQSLLEDARIRGVTFRGTGNEPGWLLEIGPGSRGMFEDHYGSTRMVFPDLKPQTDTANGATVYTGESGGRRLRVALLPQPCADTMSDEIFPASVNLEIDGVRRIGCGTPLR